MNTNSSYRKKLAIVLKKKIHAPLSTFKGAKSIVYQSDSMKNTKIPDHIKLKTPQAILKLENGCKTYNYPIENILNTNFATAYPEPKRICFVIYRINHCQNRINVVLPFIEYLLYKYPHSKKSTSDLFVFPFINKKQGGILQQANKFFKQLTGHSVKSNGYIEQEQNIFIFYNLSSVPNYKIKKIKLLTKKNELWWCLIDEICNHRKIITFPIHPSVTMLFYTNPTLIYLIEKDNKYIDIPIVAFWGNYYKFVPIVAVLGQQATSLVPILGSFYYYGSFRRAVRYAGWSPFYTKKISYDKMITDDDGKYTQGGIVRFALFTGKMKVLLNHPKNALHNYLQNKDDWVNHYQTLYIGKIKYDHHFYNINPEYIIKNHKQQVPLSLHELDMNSLKANWDPSYTGYQIV